MASPSPSPTLTQGFPADFTGQAACEAVKVLGILAGFGCLPLLRGRIPQFLWIAGLVGGVLALAAGLYYAARLWGWPPRPAKPLSSLGTALFLPVQTALIGICLLIPALVAFGLRRQAGLEPGLLLIYLCTPAILAWIGGEVVIAWPLVNDRPWSFVEAAGVVCRGLEILAALLLWTFLGLSVGTGSISLMFWMATGLAGVGLLLALAAASFVSRGGTSSPSSPAAAGGDNPASPPAPPAGVENPQ